MRMPKCSIAMKHLFAVEHVSLLGETRGYTIALQDNIRELWYFSFVSFLVGGGQGTTMFEVEQEKRN